MFFLSTRDLRAPSADRSETLPRHQFHNLGPNIFGALPTQNWGKKHAKFGTISDISKLRSRVSVKRIEISKIGKLMHRQRSLPLSAKKKSVNLIWSTHKKVGGVHFDPLKSTFSEDHISAPRKCCRLKVLHVLQNDESLLANTPPGTGVPQQFLKINISKFA